MDICDSRVTFAAEKVYFNDEVLLKDILFLTLTLGWKIEKQPSGPIELDLEAGNLVSSLFHPQSVKDKCTFHECELQFMNMKKENM